MRQNHEKTIPHNLQCHETPHNGREAYPNSLKHWRRIRDEPHQSGTITPIEHSQRHQKHQVSTNFAYVEIRLNGQSKDWRAILLCPLVMLLIKSNEERTGWHLIFMHRLSSRRLFAKEWTHRVQDWSAALRAFHHQQATLNEHALSESQKHPKTYNTTNLRSIELQSTKSDPYNAEEFTEDEVSETVSIGVCSVPMHGISNA